MVFSQMDDVVHSSRHHRLGKPDMAGAKIVPVADLTQLLQQAQAGDAQARDALFAAAYPGSAATGTRAAARRGSQHHAGYAQPGARVLSALRAVGRVARRRQARVLRLRLAGHALGDRQQCARPRRAETRRRPSAGHAVDTGFPSAHRTARKWYCRSTRHWSRSRKSTRASRRWCRCATSAATANRKLPKPWTSPREPCSGCG